MARDYYAETKVIASKLIDEGHHIWAQQLTDVIAAGATGTEIVMGLRWTLSQLLQHENGLPTDLRAEVDELHRALDKLLS